MWMRVTAPGQISGYADCAFRRHRQRGRYRWRQVEAEMRLGYHVDYYPIGDLVAYQDRTTDEDIRRLVDSMNRL